MKIGYNSKIEKFIAKTPMGQRKDSIKLQKARWKRSHNKDGIIYLTTTDIDKVIPFEKHCVGKALSLVKKRAKETQYHIRKSISEFSDFDVPTPEGLELKPFQKAGVEYAAKRDFTLFADPCGLGKAQPLTCKILTPTGWALMRDAYVGMPIIGSDGQQYQINSVYPQGQKPAYEVTFSDGTKTQCCDEHLWQVYSFVPGRIHETQSRVMSLREIISWDLCWERDPNVKICVRPIHIDFSDYDFGEEEYRARLHAEKIVDEYRETGGLYKLSTEDEEKYLFASNFTRLAYLRGFMDELGSVNKYGQTYFRCKSLSIIKHVQIIVQSLGGLVELNGSEDGRKRFCLKVNMPVPPFALARNVARCHRYRYSQPRVKAFEDIRFVGMTSQQCIRVSSPDHLYVTDDYILTHNTIQGIGVSNILQNRGRRLIICPASLKKNWSNEFKKWDTNDLTVGEVYGNDWSDADTVIINPELFERHYDLIRNTAWQLCIYDESQMFRNFEAKRTQLALGDDMIHAKKYIALSATPIESRPRELWPLLRKFDREGLGANEEDFYYRYCDAYPDQFGLVNTGASNLEELQHRLRVSFMVRRPKAVVNLKEKIRQVVTLPNAGLKQIVKEEEKAFSTILDAYENRKDEAETLKEEALERLRCEAGDWINPEQYTGSYDLQVTGLTLPEVKETILTISRVRKKLAIAKLKMVKEFVDNLLTSEDKVVIFCHHKEVANELHNYYKNSCIVTGDVPTKQRQAQVDLFQQDPTKSVFIGTYGAAGTGYTLTAAACVVCVELAQTPSAMTQAEDRVWRLGQNEIVNVYHLVVDDSYDVTMAHSIIKKQKIVDETLDYNNPIDYDKAFALAC